jgi:hypothetical protein
MIPNADSVLNEPSLELTPSLVWQSRSASVLHLLHLKNKRAKVGAQSRLGAQWNIRNGQYIPEEVQLMELGDRVQQQDGRFLT